MRTYTQLAQEQRYQIYALLKMGHNQTEIAKEIGAHKSTISRELSRNRGQRSYRPKQAHQMALNRRNKAKPRIQAESWALIESKLREDWSPEQISSWLKQNKDIQVSHERIYLYILENQRAGGDLYKHLRCQKKRRKRYGSYDRRGKLPNRRSIEERPEIVEKRQRIGDWEADTILGKGRRQAIVTLTERKSRFALLRKVERRKAELVCDAMIDLLQPFRIVRIRSLPIMAKSLLNMSASLIELEIDFFFAHPYAAWERGSNENMNGLIRQYFPKGCDFTTITDEEIEFVMSRLNNRPRKCLGFKTPFEVFYKQSVALAT